MAIVFSTHDVHPRERVAYWREAMGDVSHEFRSNVGTAFLGAVRAQMLDTILVSDFQCDPCEARRTKRNIAHAACDDFILCVPLSGRALFTQDERQSVGENGSFALLDPRRPFAVRFEGQTKCVRLRIPRQAFEARLGGAAALTAKTMDARRPLAGLTSGFLSLLPARIEALTDVLSGKLAEQALDLLALVFATEGGQGSPTLSSARAIALMRLKAAIEARLSEPDLKPAAAASSAGMGVRYANELLSQEGFSIERYILHRRLERCRRALEDPLQAHRFVGEIAFGWGFSDVSHFSRRFRSAYGLTPGDYRRRMQEAGFGAAAKTV